MAESLIVRVSALTVSVWNPVRLCSLPTPQSVQNKIGVIVNKSSAFIIVFDMRDFSKIKLRFW